MEIYRSSFGPDQFSFWVGGVKFSVLNSQIWKSAETIPGELEAQAEFMVTIPDSKAVHNGKSLEIHGTHSFNFNFNPSETFPVVFQHIPFFISSHDEEDVIYLNIELE